MRSSPGGRAPTSGPASTISTDLLHLAAWLALPAPPEGLGELGAGEQSERLSKLREMLQRLDAAATLRDVAELQSTALPLLEAALPQAPRRPETGSCSCSAALAIASEHAGARIQML